LSTRKPPARDLYWRVMQEAARRGWNTVQLSKETGVARTTINRLRDSPRRPQLSTVKTLANKLGIDLGEAAKLAGLLDDPPSTQEPRTAEWTFRVSMADALRARLPDVEPELLARLAQAVSDIFAVVAAELAEDKPAEPGTPAEGSAQARE